MLKRFMKDYTSRIDTYRRPECLMSESEVRRLYAQGHMLPFVLLLQAHNAAPSFLDPVPSPPLSFARREMYPDVPLSVTNRSFDSVSVYSDEGDPALRSRFSVSSQGSSLDGFTLEVDPALRSRFSVSPVGSSLDGFTLEIDPPSPGSHPVPEITYDAHDGEEAQVIHLHHSHPHFFHPADPAAQIISDSEEEDVGDQDEEDGPNTNQYESDANYPDLQFSNSSGSDEDELDTDGYESDPNHPINARTPLRRSAFFVLRIMQSSYMGIQLFREHLQNTADPATEQGLARLEILHILEGCSGGRVLEPEEHTAPFSPLVAFSEEQTGEDADEVDHPETDVDKVVSPGGPLTLLPWFAGPEP